MYCAGVHTHTFRAAPGLAVTLREAHRPSAGCSSQSLSAACCAGSKDLLIERLCTKLSDEEVVALAYEQGVR